MARWVTGRHKIVSRYRSYHGATHAAMSAGGDSRGWNTPDGLSGVAHVLPPIASLPVRPDLRIRAGCAAPSTSKT